ncbi:M20 family metallopeptidase [Saliterribacillus persicus]|uniref:Glutamate carboxypeptidase n=1 Tax=Saliterribacillus persicus TaxID=930114 RepID=A0A368X9R1_9BACI|nr:M20 family metallopeptidase [Saliterribacillus persicus]RCW63738.1 glutamate carboxypeptidase [Saliterribacillus persicus]
MIDYLTNKKEDMLVLLEELVNIDSGTYDKMGVDKIGQIMRNLFEKLNFVVTPLFEDEFGDHLLLHYKDTQIKNTSIIILAHMDTVFEKDTTASRKFSIKGKRAYGPGVIDMKASLVSLYYAIKTLQKEGDDAYKDVLILLTSDEEIGSLSSRIHIEKYAVEKRFALVLEPARKDGKVVTARRGKGNYLIEVQGKAAHAGIEPEKGSSAIAELAYKIIKLHDLSDPKKGIHVNVGMIEGGSSANTVSDFASAQIDVRYQEIEQAISLEEKMEEICADTSVNGTLVSLEGEMNRPPMVKTKKSEQLLKIIKETGKEFGIEIKDTATGGGSDASFTSALGIPTIDGLGPVGGNAHREDEYLDLTSLVPRTALLAQVIGKLSIITNNK